MYKSTDSRQSDVSDDSEGGMFEMDNDDGMHVHSKLFDHSHVACR